MDTPKILLVGAGDFGKHYIRLLQILHNQGEIEFAGICVQTEKSKKALQNNHPDLDILLTLDDEVLEKIDGVVIVTPAETHLQLIEKCRPYCHVLVEKPVVQNSKELELLQAKEGDGTYEVMVGQTFRFHPVTGALQRLLAERFTHVPPTGISGAFINPESSDKGRDVLLELNHLIDLMHFLLPCTVLSVDDRDSSARCRTVNLLTDNNSIARFRLGWDGEIKERLFKIHFDTIGIDIVADYEAGTLRSFDRDSETWSDVEVNAGEPLMNELRAFIKMMKGEGSNPVTVEDAFWSIAVAEKVEIASNQQLEKSSKRPKVAVIGAGVFGTNVAYELSEFADVTIFERNQDFLEEGSHVNQYRHHMGYHYPRSDETVVDIQNSTKSFDERFEAALLRDVPTYYGIAKQGSHVDGEAFKTFSDKHSLPYEAADDLDKTFFDKTVVGTIIKVPEATYHHQTMQKIVRELMRGTDYIDVRFDTAVHGCTILSSGKKKVIIKEHSTGKSLHDEEFNMVINTTYAHINTFANWIGDRAHPVRIDLAEVLIVELPIEPISLTVMDGPFGTLMTTGNPNEFTLYHAKESILDRYTPTDGRVKPAGKIVSNAHRLMSESKKLFPILEQAIVKESRIVNRGVLAHHEHDDARVADVVEHGFGCWSVLSGKIVSSVQTAKKLADVIRTSI